MVECLDKALHVVELLHHRGMLVSRDDMYAILQYCVKSKHMPACRHVHSLMLSTGFVTVLGDHLIRVFASCGSLLEANLVFYMVSKPNVYTWSAIVAAHVTLCEDERALELYHGMQQEGIRPSKFILSCILKACGTMGALGQGMQAHDQIVQSEVEFDVVVGNTLIDMYTKCGSIIESQKVFDELLVQDVVSWGAMIGAYAQHGHSLPALELFCETERHGILPDRVMYVCALNACASIGALDQGKLIHAQILKNGMTMDQVFGSALVDMYAKCGNLKEACTVFNKFSDGDVALWDTMISGYVQHGQGCLALKLFEKLLDRGMKPEISTFLCTLKACVNVQSLWHGKLVHGQIISSGFQLDTVIGTALVDMYAKCGNLNEAFKVFSKLPHHDVVSWGTIIAGYAQLGHVFAAIELFGKMQQEHIKPNKVIFLHFESVWKYRGHREGEAGA